MSEITDLTDIVAHQIAYTEEGLINQAIRNTLGNNFNLEDLGHRGKIQVLNNGTRFLYIDNVAQLIIEEATVTHEKQGFGTCTSIEIKHIYLNQ